MTKSIVKSILVIAFFSCTCLPSSCQKNSPGPNKSWTKVHTGISEAIFSSFVDDRNGLIASKDIYKTIDGGATFVKTFSSTTGKDFLAIDFIDSEHAVAVGVGIIYKSDDGGQTWSSVTPPVNNTLFWGVDFISPSVGFIAETTGKIFKTMDGGRTWTNPASIATPPLIYVRFFSATLGFASGGNGAILKTTNGGDTWAPVSYNSNEVVGVCFVDNNIGYTYEHNGVIKKTIDGGASWVNQNSGTTSALRSMVFADATTGWAVGDNGAIISTIDGGETWKSEASETTTVLNSISLTQTKIFVSGFNGTLIKRDR
jgi:photosystem II stability/assembly factor-like uncharacterized protein